MLGDSMVEVLAPRLADYALENGHELVPAIWYGSTTGGWAQGAQLGQLLRELDPSMVVVVLGSSELNHRDVGSRKKYVESIAKRVGDRKLYWIGPPNWRKDSGINDLLSASLGPDRFYRSSGLELTRKKDGIHPDAPGGRDWANAFVGWLAERPEPIVMKEPTRVAPRLPARVLGRQ
jgi:hypothetical protein